MFKIYISITALCLICVIGLAMWVVYAKRTGRWRVLILHSYLFVVLIAGVSVLWRISRDEHAVMSLHFAFVCSAPVLVLGPLLAERQALKWSAVQLFVSEGRCDDAPRLVMTRRQWIGDAMLFAAAFVFLICCQAYILRKLVEGF